MTLLLSRVEDYLIWSTQQTFWCWPKLPVYMNRACNSHSMFGTILTSSMFRRVFWNWTGSKGKLFVHGKNWMSSLD